jgi:hypothetical protein
MRNPHSVLLVSDGFAADPICGGVAVNSISPQAHGVNSSPFAAALRDRSRGVFLRTLQ